MKHTKLFRTASLALAVPALALTGEFASAQTTFFGDWTQGNDFYVSLQGNDTNPGTLAQPFATIDGALNAVAAQIGVVEVTIHLVGSGTFEQASTPITLPAHGVSLEAYDTRGGGLPTIAAPMIVNNNVPNELVWINAVGNEALAPTVIRGIRFANTFTRDPQQPTCNLRIEVAAPQDPGRIAPEIRDCVFTGEPNLGVRIIGTDGVTNETVFERNHVTGTDPFFGVIGLEIEGTADDAMSPLVRCNEIERYQTNVRLEGGGLSHQTRLQSNFVQVGNTNVSIDGCAPFLVNNTIAFAFSNTSLNATGLEWSANVPTLGLSNNLIWNPDQGGVTCTDVVGDLMVFGVSTAIERIALSNFDQDDTLFNAMGPMQPGVFSQLSVAAGDVPSFFGGDVGSGTVPIDLHIDENSSAIDAAFTFPLVLSSGDPLFADVPSAAGNVPVRRGVVYDIDFGSRLAGVVGAIGLGPADVGADEFIEFDGGVATSPTRGGVLQRTVGATFGTDLDTLGNIFPDPATGEWRSQVEVLGQPGDVVSIRLCAGYRDTVTHSNGTVLENRFVYDNQLLVPGLAPFVATFSLLGMQLDANQIELAGGTIGPNGTFVGNIALGAFDPAFVEAEFQLQAWVARVSPQNQILLQTTNRLTLEGNE